MCVYIYIHMCTEYLLTFVPTQARRKSCEERRKFRCAKWMNRSLAWCSTTVVFVDACCYVFLQKMKTQRFLFLGRGLEWKILKLVSSLLLLIFLLLLIVIIIAGKFNSRSLEMSLWQWFDLLLHNGTGTGTSDLKNWCQGNDRAEAVDHGFCRPSRNPILAYLMFYRCVILCISSVISRYIQIYPDISRYIQIYPDISRYIQIFLAYILI